MRCFITLIALVNFVGCTTLRPIEGTPPELQQRIASAELLKTGDRVLITTTDNKSHSFKVLDVRSGVVEGRSDNVPVNQIASLQKREFSRGKTIALVVVLVVLAVGGVVAIAAAHTAPAFALQ
jgi:hypothetical protein